MIFFPSKGCLLPIRISLIPLLYSSLFTFDNHKKKTLAEVGPVPIRPMLQKWGGRGAGDMPPFPPPFPSLPSSSLPPHFCSLFASSLRFILSVRFADDGSHTSEDPSGPGPTGGVGGVPRPNFSPCNQQPEPWFRIRSIWSLSPLIHYPPLPFPFCSAFCLFPLTFDPSVCVHLLPPAADDSSFIFLLLRPFLSHWSSAS